ncbi:MAG: ATP-binding protein [Gammaproteobacteria bacterium]
MADESSFPLLTRFLERAERVLERAERLLPPPAGETDWSASAYRWRHPGFLQPVHHPHHIDPADLLGIERQKALLSRNTAQFVKGLPANNVLLWGSRGTGKSSLIKAMLHTYASEGLRLIEVEAHDLIDLPDIVSPLYDRPERYIIFSDDLSFESGDASYKALKAVLDGSVARSPDNVLIYATSNRRHLLPEYQRENQEARLVEGEIHHGEAVEEKISLSERFGLWLSFHPFSQEQYLDATEHWIEELGDSVVFDEEARQEALRFALSRGSRSGRVAYQFAQDWVGRQGLSQ